MPHRLAWLALLVLLCSCADDPLASNASVFEPSVREVLIEVDYQLGAVPTTLYRGSSPWQVLKANIEALLADGKRSITVPQRLGDMQAIEGGGTNYDSEDILAIAGKHRSAPGASGRRTYYIVFLDGLFLDKGSLRSSVLGISIGNTGVIAIFKPVIATARLVEAQIFIEQSTLVHEFGHSVGLVNNGLPMAQPHHDEGKGAHCTNPDCVMFHRNEGIDNLGDFVNRLQMTNAAVLFGAECLADAAAASDSDLAKTAAVSPGEGLLLAPSAEQAGPHEEVE